MTTRRLTATVALGAATGLAGLDYAPHPRDDALWLLGLVVVLAAAVAIARRPAPPEPPWAPLRRIEEAHRGQ